MAASAPFLKCWQNDRPKSFFFPSVVHVFPTKITFFSDSPLFFPISVNIAQTKPLNYPSTLGGHILNAAVRFMTYPTL